MARLFSNSKYENALKQLEPIYHRKQDFTQQIRKVEIECALRPVDTQWTKRTLPYRDPGISGLLCFDVKYTAPFDVPLQSATVQIDIGPGINQPPVPTFEQHAPFARITAESFKQHITKTRTIDPQGELSAAGVAVKASGYSSTTAKDFEEEYSWSFGAGTRSEGNNTAVTQAYFKWDCESDHNRGGLRRPFDGALILQRDEDKPLRLRVKVKVGTIKKWQRLLYSGEPERFSKPIGPPFDNFLPPHTFENLRSELELEVFKRNLRLVTKEMPSLDQPVSEPTADSKPPAAFPREEEVSEVDQTINSSVDESAVATLGQDTMNDFVNQAFRL